MTSVERASLVFEELDRESEADFIDLYKLYEVSFPDPDERESLLSFDRLLALMGDSELQRRFGPYKEVVIAIRESASHEIVGGLVFGITSSETHVNCGFFASVQAIYIFVDEKYRGQLRPTQVLTVIRERAIAEFPPPESLTDRDIAIFFEANNPLNMTLEQIDQDHDNSGLDPYRRYHAWLHFAEPLKFKYIQPPLAPGKAAVDCLDLFYMGKGDSIPSALLIRHLYAFVSMSVLKGRDANSDPDFAKMAKDLSESRSVSFVPKSDKDQLGIIAKAKGHIREAGIVRARLRRTFPYPPLSTQGEEAFFIPRPLQGLRGNLYAVVYRLYHVLERYHILVAYAELTVGLLGLVIVGFSWFGAKPMDLWRHYSEIVVVSFLSIYVFSRGFVHTRRSRLGPDLSRVARLIRSKDVPEASMTEAATDWLSKSLLERLGQCSAFGPMLQPSCRFDDWKRLERTLAAQAAQVYSERVWGRIDKAWAVWEQKQLDKWLQVFPDGLTGATFVTAPGLVFHNLILPIVMPAGRLSRIDLDRMDVDPRVARALQDESATLAGYRTGTAQAPCLIVVRQIVRGRTRAGSPDRSEEKQLCIMMGMILQLALMLEKLSFGGDLLKGLPDGTSILVVSANRHTAYLLEWLGFRLLQRAASPEGASEDPMHGQATHPAIYQLLIGKYADLSPDAQRTLELMSKLRNEFRSRTLWQRGLAA